MTMFVYVLTTRKNTALYVGVTKDLGRRVAEHKEGLDKQSFTFRYCCDRLVYYEIHETPLAAIAREKQLKAGSRQKKLDLVNGFNPDWIDLYEKISI